VDIPPPCPIWFKIHSMLFDVFSEHTVIQAAPALLAAKA